MVKSISLSEAAQIMIRASRRLIKTSDAFVANPTQWSYCAAVLMLLGVPAASAQDGGSRRLISIIPRVSVTETLTDNVALATANRQSEQITELSPGLRVTSDAGRLKGYFDYTLNTRVYAQNTSGRSSQNALNTFGTLEAVDNFAFLDFNGAISQQAISALGVQSSNAASINGNSTESTTLRMSPYLRGRLSSLAQYEARFSLTSNRTQSLLISDVQTRDYSLNLKNQNTGSRLGWSLNATQQAIVYSAARSTESENLGGSVSYAIDPQINVSVTAGQESNNFTSMAKQSNWTSGWALNWNPSDGTKVSLSRQNRSFGESHNISVDHRTGRTVWRLSDSQDVTSTPSQTSIGSIGSTYDLYFSQFASLEPDPIKRAALVTSFLQTNGISASAPVISSFLTSAVSLQRRQDLSFSLLGLRDTVIFMATRSATSRLDTISTTLDDLSNATTVYQNGFSVSYAHRLTPDTAMNVLTSIQQSSDSQGLQDTSTRSLNMSISSKIGAKTTAALSARRVVFDSKAAPYTESAIIGTLNVQF
jgi:uncharacterized protein (PEP-CTERM system associated)